MLKLEFEKYPEDEKGSEKLTLKYHVSQAKEKKKKKKKNKFLPLKINIS